MDEDSVELGSDDKKMLVLESFRYHTPHMREVLGHS